jgi:tetratricopeptide (TPR) repeat protein
MLWKEFIVARNGAGAPVRGTIAPVTGWGKSQEVEVKTLVLGVYPMIREEYSTPPSAANVRRGGRGYLGRGTIGKCRSWLLRLILLFVLVVLGFVGMRIIDSSGIKARVLADVAGICSDQTGTCSLLKEHRGASAKSRSSVAVCEKLVGLKPGDSSARVLLGNAYAEAGRTNEAIASYREALALDADCFDAHLGMGRIHFDRGDYGEAIVSYRQALKIRPRSADAQLSLGLSLSNAGKYEEAMQAFQKARELDPAIVETQVLTGKAYLQAGLCAQAIACFKDAVQADQEHAQAYFNLGQAYLRVGDKGLALEQQQILQGLDSQLADQLLRQIGP